MKTAFVILHSAWLVMLLIMAPMAMAYSSDRGSLRNELVVSLAFVVFGCLTVVLARRRSLAVLLAMPYFFGLQYLLRKMFEELRFVQNHGTDPTGTWVTILLILGSAAWWGFCLFRGRATKGACGDSGVS